MSTAGLKIRVLPLLCAWMATATKGAPSHLPAPPSSTLTDPTSGTHRRTSSHTPHTPSDNATRPTYRSSGSSIESGVGRGAKGGEASTEEMKEEVAMSTTEASMGNGKVLNKSTLFQSGAFYMCLLALQFGLQPMLSRRYVPKAAPKMPVVWATEAFKIVICMFFLAAEDRVTREHVRKTWTLRESLRLAAFPAACYAVQNTLAQIGYQHLDSLTFNLLNQTKTIAAALCLYLLLGKPQSRPQLVALALLLAASMILNWPTSNGIASATPAQPNSFYLGVLPVLGASFLSGLSAATTQRALQGEKRNSYLLSLELAVFGQIFLFSTMVAKDLPKLVASLTGDAKAASTTLPTEPLDAEKLYSAMFATLKTLFNGWNYFTLLPCFTQAAGGVVVGLVTKYAGGVAKGFALIGGILVTAFVQAVINRRLPPPLHWFAAVLVALSTYLHAKYPPRAPSNQRPPSKRE